MKYITFGLAALMFLLSSCGSVPITGRKQLLTVSDQDVLTLSLQEYDEFMKTAPKSTNQTQTALVQKVGKNIANAVESYFKANGLESQLSNYAWEFNLVKSTDVNAFCRPGGKIVVYEGFLPYTQDETGLAVVLGHEVAHAVAKHANERMSQQQLAQYGSAGVGVLLSGASSTAQQVGSSIFGLTAQYGAMLPFSRKQELEADHLGLVFMAMAGYNPELAESFWQRMSQNGSASIAEFMSTHPSDNTRITKIREELPEALQYYKGGSTTKTSSSSTKTSTTVKNAKTSPEWTF
jgi:predicted Zn-dependent protease